ncbi:MAG TPA: ABC transporter ATP-binding protein [Sedimentibacter sp.]|jgi:ABC-2 type transport system ATP-binding protein|nr:ABC transporter ATP-binding protein [Sedimentibacter sp.]NLA13531.1 ABC transporter ATP-binding protein [Tissierellia bacterium]HAS90708.1 ABC transporter [Clostridiales bacterium]HOA19187.1 ABC transporter ATP-binding protein [Sedimentibacter sp.]HOG61968.1 ABC transporter ATP-binding protein [Sedimentibacter sp.]
MSEVLRLEHVSKSFGSKDVLKDINFSVNSGEIIGYIGSNGAGKTTTIKIILGLIDDYQGDVFIFGEKVKGQFEYKKRIGYVPEVSDMYDNLTAYEYLSFIGMLYGIGEDKAVKKGKEMMSVFGIDDAINGRIHTFSKGMRQKLSIITGMIHNPDILFLDEPLGGIDANSVLVFKEVLKNLKKEGKTIFYSSHILEVVEKLSDRILLINEGEIVIDGTVADVMSMQSDSSLESIFNYVTGFHDYEMLAKKYTDVFMS